MTIWKKKRQVSGLSRADMANELGLNYDFYNAIEKGDVKMPSNLIDKFNEIVNRGKENELTNVINDTKADEFWNEVRQQREDGTYILTVKMREFNIPNLPTLVNLLGYKSTGTVYNYLQGKNNAGPEFKKRLYNFFSNELNIQIPTKVVGKSETGTKRKRERAVNKTLDDYYNKTDFKKIMKENNICGRDIARAINVNDSTISTMVRKKYKPSYTIIGKVKEYLDNATNATPNYEPAIEVTDLVPNYVEEKKSEPNKVVERYQNELNEIDDIIEMYSNKIKDLQIRKKICVEVLDAIKEIQTIDE